MNDASSNWKGVQHILAPANILSQMHRLFHQKCMYHLKLIQKDQGMILLTFKIFDRNIPYLSFVIGADGVQIAIKVKGALSCNRIGVWFR